MVHNDNGGSLSQIPQAKWFNLHKVGYNLPESLDYLALGDSYSSGEGDTEKNEYGDKYYRPYTNNEENKNAGIPREKCHISTRSYPYKLAEAMDLAKDDPKQWDTIACSGATAWDVKKQASLNYAGQNKGASKVWSWDAYDERLKGYDVSSLKVQALNEFIPGRQKQIEFVKKYKPKAVTLTIGGNDVDFGGKMSKCVINPNTSCEISTEDGRKKLGKELQDQFKNLTFLYKELRAASSSTRIFIVGYPQIVNGTPDASCPTNIGGLDAKERRVIEEGYAYMNDVIEAAAKHIGVKYIDVEDSFSGHKLCDGSRDTYATGVAFSGDSERQESFHPNAKGNQAIADMVQERLRVGSVQYTLLDYPYEQQADPAISTPALTPYLSGSSDQKKVVTKKIAPSAAQKNSPIQIFMDVLSLGPTSLVNLFLHSDPIELGEYTVSEDGSLDATITIPENVPAGYHTLVLEGVTYSGEPVQYEQVIFVHGSNLNDIDEDGIDDSVDPCLFITPTSFDEDRDGIDDACDPEIGEAPQDPYRVRAGNPGKTYAGQPEKESNL